MQFSTTHDALKPIKNMHHIKGMLNNKKPLIAMCFQNQLIYCTLFTKNNVFIRKFKNFILF